MNMMNEKRLYDKKKNAAAAVSKKTAQILE